MSGVNGDAVVLLGVVAMTGYCANEVGSIYDKRKKGGGDGGGGDGDGDGDGKKVGYVDGVNVVR